MTKPSSDQTQPRMNRVDRMYATSRRPPALGTAPPPGAVSLAMGEPFDGTPAPVVDAAVSALHAGRTRYEPLTGSPALREELADQLSTPARSIEPAEVVLTHGGSAGLAAVILAMVNPGDRVVLPEPTYSLYADHVAAAGGDVVWVTNHPDGTLDHEQLAAELPTARLAVLCNPSNPTGHVLSRADLENLLVAGHEHGVYVLCDEAYRDIIFDDAAFTSVLQLADVAERVICCGTFSKSYAMTGWRIGYVVASSDVADSVNFVHRTVNGALNTFVQDAARVALSLPSDRLSDQVRRFQHNRDLVLDALAELEFVSVARPQGTFYAFPRIRGAVDSETLTRRLADAGVLVRAGSEYGPSGEGHLRISYATDEPTLREGLRRLTSTLADLCR